MEVILLERIERLGQMGDVVKVKPGYARNYLLPQKKALRANEENRKHFENQRAQLETANLERRGEAEAVAEKLDGLQCVIIRQAGETGQMYGSVSARDIADTVSEAGFSVTRQQILLAHNIKALGIYECRVALHPEVIVTVSINVARTEEEAKTQIAEALEDKKKEAKDQDKAEKGAAGEEKETGKKTKKKQSVEDEESEGAGDSKGIVEAAGDDAGAETSSEPSSGDTEETPSESEATSSPQEGDSPDAPGEDKTG